MPCQLRETGANPQGPEGTTFWRVLGIRTATIVGDKMFELL